MRTIISAGVLAIWSLSYLVLAGLLGHMDWFKTFTLVLIGAGVVYSFFYVPFYLKVKYELIQEIQQKNIENNS